MAQWGTTRKLSMMIVAAVLPFVWSCGAKLAVQPGHAEKAVSVESKKNSIGMEFVRIARGKFKMGHPEHRQPVKVERVKKFWLARYEVTNAQLADVLPKRANWAAKLPPKWPAVGVSRTVAIEFAKALGKREGKTYRLPTEAEWEFAARGGIDQANYPWGNEPKDNAMCNGSLEPMPVGSYASNAYGLYDMTGNAAELVAEDYWDDESLVSEKGDPLWMARGGGYRSFNSFVWFAAPLPVTEERDGLLNDVGFRVVWED